VTQIANLSKLVDLTRFEICSFYKTFCSVFLFLDQGMAKNKPSQEEMLSKWGETCRVFEYPVPTWMSRRLCTKGGEKLKSIMAQANLNHIWYNNHYYTPGQFEDFVKLYSNDWEKIQQAIKIIDEIQVQEEKLPEWSDKNGF